MPVDGDESMQIDEVGTWSCSSTSDLRSEHIVLQCSFCREVFSAPELLCDHVTDHHDTSVPLWHQRFATKQEFSEFMKSVEEHRSERVGYVHPHFHFDFSSMRENLCDNYYTFCDEIAQPLKRRKLDDSSDGSHMVIYCLDHSCGCANDVRINAKVNTKCLKRNHENAQKDGPSEHCSVNLQEDNSDSTSCDDAQMPDSARSVVGDLPSCKISFHCERETKRKNASTASDPPDVATLLESINEGLSQAHIKGGRSQSVDAVDVCEPMEVVNRESVPGDPCPCA
ncbi:hypothetical protein QR680_012782 [Steinernema hermaphroditum]|uniref:C2H2-type domain-containing protein n=1 Tax=Steinernema hermaphroditum TaxID=289476 RepID=A0AA39I360_9BILA|nr:hypothetical protein QR680_012782 [Steinernema hermaphroditum]